MPILGLDVGASKIYYVVLENSKRLLEGEIKFPIQTKEEFLATCQTIAKEIKNKNLTVEKAGIGLPGTIKDGVLTYVANFPALTGLDITSELRTIFNVPITVTNDAKAFIQAETAVGAAKGLKNVVGLTLGSGLGGGLVLGGVVYFGKGNAGEVGHEILDLTSMKEAEDFVSAKFFKKFGEDPLTLQHKAEAVDANAKSAYEEFGRNLGVVVANLVNLLDPQMIVLGGGLSAAYDLFIGKTKETAADLIVNPESKNIPILKSMLGPAAGAIGAALLAS